MNKQEAAAKLVANFNNALNEAEAFADEHGLDFHISPEYGMGGTYYGEGHEYTWAEQGWNPSSQSC